MANRHLAIISPTVNKKGGRVSFFTLCFMPKVVGEDLLVLAVTRSAVIMGLWREMKLERTTLDLEIFVDVLLRGGGMKKLFFETSSQYNTVMLFYAYS